MRRALPAPHYILTSVLGAAEWSIGNVDLKRVCDYLDLVNVVTYDFCGTWSEEAGHASGAFPPAVVTNSNQQAPTIMSVLRYYIMLQGVPSHKINIGIPCFGRSFLGANHVGDSCAGYGGNNGIFSYYDLPRPNASEAFDNVAIAAYCTGGDGGFVSYDVQSPPALAVD